MLRLRNRSQNYAWGKIGANSLVTKFLPDFNPELPYAELWIGTHPSLESFVGAYPLSGEVGNLPYLLKILSIEKPLSIQVHPDLAHAQALHDSNPKQYPDNNHKPELCVALNRMEVLYGLKTEEEVELTLAQVQELRGLVGMETTIRNKVAKLFEDEEETRRLTGLYIERVKATDSVDPYSRLAFYLHSHFPEDVGIFFALMMNYVMLEPGDGLFIEDGTPHAYLSGDCVEAQACSDNVIRAGLTPKPKDSKTLLEIMNLRLGRPEIIQPSDQFALTRYNTPCEEFALWKFSEGGRLAFPQPTCVVIVDGAGSFTSEREEVLVKSGESYVITEPVVVKGHLIGFACTKGT